MRLVLRRFALREEPSHKDAREHRCDDQKDEPAALQVVVNFHNVRPDVSVELTCPQAEHE